MVLEFHPRSAFATGRAYFQPPKKARALFGKLDLTASE